MPTPKKITCPKCKGTGQVYNKKDKSYSTCSRCKRFGWLYASNRKKKWKKPKELQSMKKYYKNHPELVKLFGELAKKIEKYLKK